MSVHLCFQRSARGRSFVMRLVKVNVPRGLGNSVVQMAFSSGIQKVTTQEATVHAQDGSKEIHEIVDVQTSTPKAKAFIDAVTAAPFYDTACCSINVRQPRSISSGENPLLLTLPLVEPSLD